MAEIELPIFGKVKLNTETWYNDVRKWGYKFEEMQIDLAVIFKGIKKENILKVSAALNNLTKIHKVGKTAIQEDFEKGETVKEFLEEWKDDIFFQIFSAEEFEAFLKTTDKTKNLEERLLSKIRLVSIDITDEFEDNFITMDFAFGYDDEKGFRENMLVVKLTPNLAVKEISIEG